MNDTVTVIDVVAQVTDETATGTKGAQDNLSKLEKSMIKLQKQMERMKGKTKLEVFATLKDTASKGIQNIAAAGKQIAGKVWTVTLKAKDLVTAPFKKIWGMISNPVTQAVAFTGVSLGLADTVNTFKDFEQGMANIKAISGATDAEFMKLTETVKALGETTMFSAAQVAGSAENLAMAGWKPNDIISGMPGLLNLAAAGSVDLDTASNVTSSVLAQFSLDPTQSNHVADVLAATTTNSKTNVGGLGESLKYAGVVSGQLGYSVDDTAFVLGLMGEKDVDGTTAGNMLKTGLLRLAKQENMTADETNAMAEAADRLHISMKNDDGTMKSLKTLLDDMRKGFSGITDETERASLANALFGQEASVGMLALMDTTEEGAKKYNDLYAAIENCDGVAEEIADIKMDTLQGSLLYLQSAAEGVKIAMGEKLQPYVKGLVDWVTAHMPDIQNAVGSAVDFVTGKIDGVMKSVQSLTGSAEWQKAETLWDKIGLAWDKLIAEPFDTWWNGKGKTWLTEKAGSIGEGLGGALKTGILGLLGIDAGGVLTEGTSVGKSFFDGFMQGFDWKKVASELGKALWDGLKSLLSDAATLLPGGEAASGTSLLSTAALGYGTFKTAKAGYGVYKGVKSVAGGIKAGMDIVNGIRLFNAAGSDYEAAVALKMAQAGELGAGVNLGTAIAPIANKVANKAAKALPWIGGVVSAAQMGLDAYHGVGKAKEWTGSDSTGAKIASGIGAALGGTGSGIFGDESIGTKALNIGSGALKGAGIGAAIGSILPGIGTAIGGALGAGIGALGAAIGGSTIAKGLTSAGNAIKGFFTETVPTKFEELINGIGSFFTEKVPFAVGYAAGKITVFFTETLPGKWDEFINGVETFFTETIPNATDAIVKKAHTFFTETLPKKWDELWDGILGFFTRTLPDLGNSLREGFENFVNGVKEKIGGIFGWIGGIVTGSASTGNGVAGKLTKQAGSIHAGYSAAIDGAKKHAEGGILTAPHLGLVAEDGAEAIIPLSSKRRERGIDLWEQAGQMLGIRPYAEGGVFSNQSGGQVPAESSARGAAVNIGTLSFDVHIDGEKAQDAQSTIAALRENILSLTDDIACSIAVKLEQANANTPTVAWGCA